jgi:hypothetical protein
MTYGPADGDRKLALLLIATDGPRHAPHWGGCAAILISRANREPSLATMTLPRQEPGVS